MGSDWDADLAELRFHWDTAYIIECFGLGCWVAQRRDSHATIGADGPEKLRDLIAADYRKHPVPRDPRPCRFLPEG